MPFQEMKIKDAWIHTPTRHSDERGHFEEQFKLSQIESQLGRVFEVKQVNQSVSNRGVIRGIHYTAGIRGQAKYVSCPRGAIWDVVVDLRENSPTFGKWDAIELSAENGLSVFISEGLGHAFLSLKDGTAVNYLCSGEYDPNNERTINPLSETLSIEFESTGISNFILSAKDSSAKKFQPK
jgi:dTDP-4-dehydrorhamnose 3,5-epimerase